MRPFSLLAARRRDRGRAGRKAGAVRAGRSASWAVAERPRRAGRRREAQRGALQLLVDPAKQTAPDTASVVCLPDLALALPHVSPLVPATITARTGDQRFVGQLAKALAAEGILTDADYTGDLSSSIDAALARLVLETGCGALEGTDLKLTYTEDVGRGFPDLNETHYITSGFASGNNTGHLGGFAIWGSSGGEIVLQSRVEWLEEYCLGFGWSAMAIAVDALRETLGVYGFDNAASMASVNDEHHPEDVASADDIAEGFGERLSGRTCGTKSLRSQVPDQAFASTTYKKSRKFVEFAKRSGAMNWDRKFARIVELSESLLTRLEAKSPWPHFTQQTSNVIWGWGDLAFLPCMIFRWTHEDDVTPLCHDACNYDMEQMAWSMFQWLSPWDWNAESPEKPGGIRYSIRCLRWHLQMLGDGWELAQHLNGDPRLMAVLQEGRVRV